VVIGTGAEYIMLPNKYVIPAKLQDVLNTLLSVLPDIKTATVINKSVHNYGKAVDPEKSMQDQGISQGEIEFHLPWTGFTEVRMAILERTPDRQKVYHRLKVSIGDDFTEAKYKAMLEEEVAKALTFPEKISREKCLRKVRTRMGWASMNWKGKLARQVDISAPQIGRISLWRHGSLELRAAHLDTPTMSLYCKPVDTFAGDRGSFLLEVAPTDRIRDLRVLIEEMEGVSPADQILVYVGKVLEDKHMVCASICCLSARALQSDTNKCHKHSLRMLPRCNLAVGLERM